MNMKSFALALASGWIFFSFGLLAGQGGEEDAPKKFNRVSVRGIVRDEDGAPVSGADIYAYQENASWFQRDLRAQTQSDKAGSFTMEMLPGTDAESWHYILYVLKDGYAWDYQYMMCTSEDLSTYPLDPRSDRSLEFTLGRAGTVSGHVFDTNGVPISDAVVYPSYVMPPGTTIYLPSTKGIDFLAVRTNRDGQFLFDNLPLGAFCGFAVTADGHAAITVSQFSREASIQTSLERCEVPAAGIQFRLCAEARLSGSVEDVDGFPLADVEVYAKEKGYDRDGWCEKTKANGTFSFAGLPPGEYIIKAAEYSQEALLYEPVTLSVGEGNEIQNIHLKREDAVLVQGRILDSITGHPIPFARISIGGEGWRWVYVQADDQGRYRFSASYGKYLWTHLSKACRPVVNRAFYVPPGRKEVAYDFMLQLRPKIILHIFDAQGQAVSGAVVSSPIKTYARADGNGFATLYIIKPFSADHGFEMPAEGVLLKIVSPDKKWIGSFTVPRDNGQLTDTPEFRVDLVPSKNASEDME